MSKQDAFQRLVDFRSATWQAPRSEVARERFYAGLEVFSMFSDEDIEGVYEDVQDALIARYERSLADRLD